MEHKRFTYLVLDTDNGKPSHDRGTIALGFEHPPETSVREEGDGSNDHTTSKKAGLSCLILSILECGICGQSRRVSSRDDPPEMPRLGHPSRSSSLVFLNDTRMSVELVAADVGV